MPVQAIRDEFLATLSHLELVVQRVAAVTQPRGKVFASPDQYRIAEGLFLSAWTHWEQFIRALLISDFSSDAAGVLAREVRQFRTKGAAHRLATLILDHPDDDRWIEWSGVAVVVARADAYLGPSHRYRCLLPRQQTFQALTPIRNAVAHKSDVAWTKFRKLVQSPPFSLQPGQMKGITVGRFLTAHRWRSNFVIFTALGDLSSAAKALVP